MAFFNIFKKAVPGVAAQSEEEEELVDPQVTLKGECEPHCKQFQNKLNECNERVNSRTMTAETCAEELYDFVHCIDHCVAKTLFNHLK